MIKSINEYLSQLKTALAGSDPAIIRDALADAEEYLRNALNTAREKEPEITEASALPPIIEKYGTPEEVAAAYKEIEIRTPPTLAPARTTGPRPPLARFFGVFADPRAWGALFYLLFFSLFSGVVYFSWVVTGISLSAGLIVLIIGLPFIGLFILSVRGIALVEGRIVESLLGVRMPRRPAFSGRNPSWWARFKGLLKDRHTWFSLVYMILQLPLGIIYFTVFVTLIAVALSGLALPVLDLIFKEPLLINNVAYFPPGWLMVLSVLAGILLLTLTMHLARACGRMHGALAKSLLVQL